MLRSASGGAVWLVSLVFLALTPPSADGSLIVADAVFAHDFESIAGNTITAVVGPNAVKTANVAADTADPLRVGSQHVQAPNGAIYASVDTNTRLTSTITALSFSIFYNDRGDNGSERPIPQARLLSSFNGTGAPPAETAFQTRVNAGVRRLTFSIGTAGGFVLTQSDPIPTADANWHHAGIVFDLGTVTFYFDGAPLGAPIAISETSISAQTFDWFLIEDAAGISDPEEYFDNGDYDEAALWYRPLSSSEMGALASQGLSASVPEPTSLASLGFGLAALALRWRRISA